MTGLCEGQVAIVTGGTNGIGEGIAKALAAEGASVTLTGRNAERGAQVVSDIEAAGGKALFLEQNVQDEARWPEVVAETVAAFGKLDLLVNNAGKFLVKTMDETTLDEFIDSWEINVESVFLGMKAAIPEMEKLGKGNIINVSSLMGIKGLETASAYCSTKGAVVGMTKAAAMEYAAKNIRINCIIPGVIWTDMVTGQWGGSDEMRQGLIDTTPIRDVGAPEDIAGGAVYLASEEAKYITGFCLHVDGGRGCD